MPCYSPITAYYSKEMNENGKRPLTFNPTHANTGIQLNLPCGQCIGCKLEKSRQWAMRCVHEAQLHDQNAFVTLTYDENNIPPGGTLVPTDLQLFLKRLRKAQGPGIRFYASGEYGTLTQRPHYHAILFNTSFDDMRLYKTTPTGERLYTSAKLAKLRSDGNHTIGAVTFESAAYVARYVVKKITGELAEQHYNGRHPEFSRMSRRPGVGSAWIEKFHKQTYTHDKVVMRGQEVRPPKYYDTKYEILDNEKLQMLKKKRRRTAMKHLKNNTPERRKVREQVQHAKLNLRRQTI